ncbi:MAG: vitamin B12-dependent ribonucleotide reductase [bacterium]|nr:vitamin B12-dependent ribonucleotide reductase [bacterium]
MESASESATNENINSLKSAARGLKFPRFFSEEGVHPYDRLQWELREAQIGNEKGEVVFSQKNVEVPASWSQMATNVVASKYFRGAIDSPTREHSAKQLVSRVAGTIARWGREDGYFVNEEQKQIFEDELTAILIEQYGAFNSPVWFNVGVEPHPQCSACFILSVEDEMESLLELQRAEAMLFKYGSGAGSNLSNIRSKKELLSGGGIPSGPVSFMKGFDAWAGTIKSGGKTRRAAKMQILDVDHPDIMEFIQSKRFEEEKAWALIEQGYAGGFNIPGGAYDSVFFQNANLSVRVTDDFMKAVVEGKNFPTIKRTSGEAAEYLDARTVLKEIAYGTWLCGDPGLQYDTIINDWHTCPNTGRINASNPCSEYMHVDDSACNLASINLLKFVGEDGSFDLDRFLHTVDIFITAQDIVVDNASYPTEKIGANARAFRQLGLGFANLGAMLMTKGLAYDSDAGRDWAATMMSLISGEAYLMSSRLAEEVGPFGGFKLNREPMLKVIGMHTDASKKLSKQFVTETLVEESQAIWMAALERGREHGMRNSQATVLAPTGTIAFLMDCDTTGIEPDVALVKYKKLVGGGMLKIVNNSVPRALRALGYNQSDIDTLIKHIDETDTIEGCPVLKEEHLSIFDCAFPAANGQRSIQYMGHVKMMAACQPFVSGAISKTVNMPHESTAEEIYDTYLEGWKLGLKAIAIYRDGSKRSQPLSTSKDEGDKKQVAEEVTARPARRYLPDERQAVTHKFNVGGHEGYLTVGLYEDGTPGEIFLVMAKEGSTLSGVMDAYATSISLALQHGVPLSTLVKKFSHMRFEPSGFTTNQQIPFAKSILDYIFRWLGTKFLPVEEQIAIGIKSAEYPAVESSSAPAAKTGAPIKSASTNGNGHHTASAGGSGSAITDSSLQALPYVSDDAPPCSACGSSLMVRQGACYRCLNCGAQGGCG